ncbi:hypothetical protein GXW82_32660 [Streptacidiphilus sp. 4-A2]|nr:hypothetical protein [Streptacidiphilus sp. 4-A2]
MIRTIRRTTAHRALGAAGLLVTGAVLLTGCSSSSSATATASPSATASTASAGGSGSAQFTAYRQCLSQHGVTLPSGRPSGQRSHNPSAHPSHSGGYGGGGYGGGFGFGGGASESPAMQAAQKACAADAPKGGFGRGGGAAGSSALVAFESCMKSNGVTVTGGMRSLATTDPKTAAALKVCKVLLPTRGGANPSATPSA